MSTPVQRSREEPKETDRSRQDGSQSPRPNQETLSSVGGIVPSSGQICSNCGTSKTPLWRRSPTGAIICNACGLYQKARNSARPVQNKQTESIDAVAVNQQISATDDTVPGNETARVGSSSVSCTTPIGSCPGGGQCNGTGGADGCNGCPAFNNRLAKKPQATSSRPTARLDNGKSRSAGQQSLNISATDTPPAHEAESSCKNCGTTVTPLWRRDENGHTICNACGLYHKLHGSHRPVAMKKSTIKRRKRVVPYALDSPASPGQSSEASASPEPSPIMLKQDIRPRFMPAIDFTGYYVHPRDGSSHILPPLQINSDQESRKRTLSISQEVTSLQKPSTSALSTPTSTSRKPGSITSLLNPPHIPTQKEQHEMVFRDKESKKARLEQEAEGLRSMLLAKERELQELSNDN